MFRESIISYYSIRRITDPKKDNVPFEDVDEAKKELPHRMTMRVKNTNARKIYPEQSKGCCMHSLNQLKIPYLKLLQMVSNTKTGESKREEIFSPHFMWSRMGFV